MHVIFQKTPTNEVFFKGHLHLDGKLITESHAPAVFLTGDFDNFKKQVSSAKGNFAVIVQKGHQLWAAVDKLRSIPLFYGQN
ncbi:unnamed protein product, partial [marine sediment metagenome]